ncbi:bifunctional adenosylcobinamide kinase/adenosylcobinamide-phosphate guanylyltransferase [Rubrobacter marinus]|uniref:bifunctional adenosylcobinamide kinase/adenosylcobinamide-phosphate guanylyltransferase n=1 Tax=Rubrobacter marinus TaxID=2653852 RepID=UPI001A9EBE39|nr:bifunctional adenosylcobinamide kinase/adenosylcobinamide-phosphate guanylyltransferase [Rubrobacter marinus]
MLGGARSGKSSFAEEISRGMGGDDVLYVATAVVSGGDEELARRVGAHRERRPAGWGLLELSGGGLGPVLDAARGRGAVLFDSLTLWVSARMCAPEDGGTLEELDRFLAGAAAIAKPVVLVSDEVGLGLVPESAEGRRFRDLLGLVNQRAAAAADEVYLCVAGVPLRIK